MSTGPTDVDSTVESTGPVVDEATHAVRAGESDADALSDNDVETDAAPDAATQSDGNASDDLEADDAVDLATLPLEGCLEAVLMVSDEPLPAVVLAQVLRRPQPEVESALRSLAEEYTADGRGFELREVAGGWRFYSRPEFAAAVQHFVLDGQQARLTQASLETLAVVAYRQPVSRARVSAIRGVNVDSVMRTLTARGLVEEAGEDPSTGAHLYRTSAYFLERLGVASLDELPELPPHLPTVEDLEAEL